MITIVSAEYADWQQIEDAQEEWLESQYVTLNCGCRVAIDEACRHGNVTPILAGGIV